MGSKNIRKSSGILEPFDIGKLRISLIRSGASELLADEIAHEIERWLPDGILSKRVYEKAYALLLQHNRSHAVKYRLKQALFELGPSGHPFEMLVGEIFSAMGFSTEVALVVDGQCVTHEMDVIATKGQEQVLVECKFAHSSEKHVGIQVPLYVNSRVADIAAFRSKEPVYKGIRFKGCVATNTRFSPDSVAYSTCSGIQLIGWDYPSGNGLKDLMERFKVFPITIIKSLLKPQKQYLLDNNIVTCRQLAGNPDMLDRFGFPELRKKGLMEEVEGLVGGR